MSTLTHAPETFRLTRSEIDAGLSKLGGIAGIADIVSMVADTTLMAMSMRGIEVDEKVAEGIPRLIRAAKTQAESLLRAQTTVRIPIYIGDSMVAQVIIE